MPGRLRRILIALLILAGVVALAYHSRHKIHLADFTWKRFISSVGQANIFVLLLCLVGIYGCYAIRAIRWQRFCKYVGPTNFLNTYAGTLMGFAAIFVLGRAGEPVRNFLFGAFLRFLRGCGPCLPGFARISQSFVRCRRGYELGG